MPVPQWPTDWRFRERRGKRRKRGWQTSGGIVVDVASGKVALVKNRRERRDGWSGWTWPKGLIDPGEGPLFTAIREIREECGIEAEPVAWVTSFRTKRALRHYFVLTKIRDGFEFSRETIDVRWVSLDKARKLLDRRRDRRVLEHAAHTLRALQRGKPLDGTLMPQHFAA